MKLENNINDFDMLNLSDSNLLSDDKNLTNSLNNLNTDLSNQKNNNSNNDNSSDETNSSEQTNKVALGNIFELAKKQNALPKSLNSEQNTNNQSAYFGKENYYDSNDTEITNLEVLLEDQTTSEDFEVLQNFGSIIIPQNVEQIFKDNNNNLDVFNNTSEKTPPPQRTTLDYDSVILNSHAIERLMQSEKSNANIEYDELLSSAMSPEHISYMVKDKNSVLTHSPFSRRRRRGINPYMDNSANSSLEQLLSHIHLPADSLAESSENITKYSEPKPSFNENSFDFIKGQEHFNNYMTGLGLGFNAMPMNEILNIPKKNDYKFEEFLDYSQNSNDYQIGYSATKLEVNLANNTDILNIEHSDFPDYLQGFRYENMVPHEFFKFYIDPEHSKNSVMWDHNDDLNCELLTANYSDFQANFDLWENFDLEHDWIDLTFALADNYTIDVFEGDFTSSIIIKNANEQIVQGITINNKHITYELVQSMQEHITNPYSSDLLSFGKRFGIFSVDSKESWFSGKVAKLGIIEFVDAQNKINTLQNKIDVKENNVVSDNSSVKKYLNNRGFTENNVENLTILGITL